MKRQRNAKNHALMAVILSVAQLFACGMPPRDPNRLAEADGGEAGDGGDDGSYPVAYSNYVAIDDEGHPQVAPIIITNPAAAETGTPSSGLQVSAPGVGDGNGQFDPVTPHQTAPEGSSGSGTLGQQTDPNGPWHSSPIPPSSPQPETPPSLTPSQPPPQPQQPPPAPTPPPTPPLKTPELPVPPPQIPPQGRVDPGQVASDALVLWAKYATQMWDNLHKQVTEWSRATQSTLPDGQAARHVHPAPSTQMLRPRDYPFKTPVNGPAGQRLAEAWLYKKAVGRSIQPSSPDAKSRQELVVIADASFHKADDAFEHHDPGSAEFALRLGYKVLDIAVDATKALWSRDTYEAVLGRSFYTGQRLSDGTRAMAMLTAAGAICAEVAIGGSVAPAVAIAGGMVVLVAVLQNPKAAKIAMEWANSISGTMYDEVVDNPVVTEPVQGGKIVEPSDKPMSAKERRVAERLKLEGKSVEKVRESSVSTVDFKVDGAPTEIKTLDPESGEEALHQAIKKGAKQGEGENNIIVDVSDTNLELSKEDIKNKIMPRVKNSGDIRGKAKILSVRFIGKNFDRTWLP